MPDEDITQLGELETVASGDLLAIVDDPGGVPVTKKITQSNLLATAVLIDGSRALSGDWDIGDGRKIQTDEIQARDGAGLKLTEDGGAGIFIQDSTGNVGIGTTSPQGTGLDISATTPALYLTENAGSHDWKLTHVPSDATLRFQYDATSKVTFDDNGNVGIGTTGPASKLHILGDASDAELHIQSTHSASVATTAINFRDNGGVTRWQIGSNKAVGGGFEINQGEDTTNRVYIDMNGKVGIGTTDPTALCDVNSDILRLRAAKTPASSGAAGNQGDICWDADFIYVCTATNTWERAAIVAW